jgi:diguanylate cyclase (GGDEF)-like protein
MLKTLSYRQYTASAILLRQRWLILCSGGAYALACLWISFRIGAPAEFAIASFALLVVTLVLYGATYAKASSFLIELNVVIFTGTFGAHVVIGALAAPTHGAARCALLLSFFGLLAVVSAPTLRATLAALTTLAVVALAGLFVYLPQHGVTFASIETLSYWLPVFAVTTLAAFYFEADRRRVFELRTELERRATSDTLTGVSNRTHINLLAQNEFARARRYGEPYSCLMLEIDGYDALLQSHPAASDVVVQVFTGYCVVVMRHCDSFGRLGDARFLALLPETEGDGALTLAERMCRDLSGLDVMVDGEALNFTVSIGAAELHPVDRWAGDLLRRVEQGLEDAIERGRNNAVFAAPPTQPPHGISDTDDIAAVDLSP